MKKNISHFILAISLGLYFENLIASSSEYEECEKIVTEIEGVSDENFDIFKKRVFFDFFYSPAGENPACSKFFRLFDPLDICKKIKNISDAIEQDTCRQKLENAYNKKKLQITPPVVGEINSALTNEQAINNSPRSLRKAIPNSGIENQNPRVKKL